MSEHLTSKQKRFIALAIEYETDNIRAYMEAYGVDITTARVNALRTLKNAKIAKEITDGINEAREKRNEIRNEEYRKKISGHIASKEEVLAFMTRVMLDDPPFKVDGKEVPTKMGDRIAAGKVILESEAPIKGGVSVNVNVPPLFTLSDDDNELLNNDSNDRD